MTVKLDLLTSQKNEVLEIIQQHMLDPINFRWSIVPSRATRDATVSTLEYRGPPFHFLFDQTYTARQTHAIGGGGYMSSRGNVDGPYVCEWSPASGTRVKNRWSLQWSDVLQEVVTWASTLKKELNAPDLWGEIKKYEASLSLVPPDDLVNEPIPAYEVDQITEKLKILAEKMEAQFQLNEKEREFVRSKLDYLADAAKRQRRLDWVHTFIGAVITIAFGLAMDTPKFKALCELVRQVFGQVIHFITGS